MIETDNDEFPFDVIVVTSPDESSAAAAKAPFEEELSSRLRAEYPGNTKQIPVVSTCDPYGARCGSGGGTLAALEEAYLQYPNLRGDQPLSICVLHAGGDSSRCPTQMILGKAWMALPSPIYSNPCIFILFQLAQLARNIRLPQGSLVVAATDCLLLLDVSSTSQEPLSLSTYNSLGVLGVTVPAPIRTSKNHGVFVLDRNLEDGSPTIHSPTFIWQKPSIEKLQGQPKATFETKDNSDLCAWIDTGVIVFLPEATKKLRQWSGPGGFLGLCTRSGLKKAYQDTTHRTIDAHKIPNGSCQQAAIDDGSGLRTFARQQALKVDLYTDILHNLSTKSQNAVVEAREANLQKLLRQSFQQLTFETLVVPRGHFLHLGTTRELADFLLHPTNNFDSFLAMQSSLGSSNVPENHSAIVLYSKFPQAQTDGKHHQGGMPTVELSSNCIVEYSDFSEYDQISIGKETLVSGWRSPTGHSQQHSFGQTKTSLSLPSQLCIQMVPTRPAALADPVSASAETMPTPCCVVLGINDPVKAVGSDTKLYGIPVMQFLGITGLDMHDLGWSGESSIQLWTAKIHPLIEEGGEWKDYFGWLDDIMRFKCLTHDKDLLRWKTATRVSLRDLHSLAESSTEWKFRNKLKETIAYDAHIHRTKNLISERLHSQPCRLEPLLASDYGRKTLIEAMLGLARAEVLSSRYDTCGRCLMIASHALSLHGRLSQREQLEQSAAQIGLESQRHQTLRHTLAKVCSSDDLTSNALLLDEICLLQRSFSELPLTENGCVTLSRECERIAFALTSKCIILAWSPSLNPKPDIRSEMVFMASAPARIDLAGGWTDTPPICYEHGGSVTGVAVRLDGRKPLCCRSRVVEGSRGVFMRTECRHYETGAVLSFNETICTDLMRFSDYDDPTAACSLIKATLVCIGLIPQDMNDDQLQLQQLLNRFYGSEKDVGLEIVSTSLLPQGSGMGTSSILAGCILASVSSCLGIELSLEDISCGVLMVEQLLTSGGGYQDQINGLYPGFKAVSTEASHFPLEMNIRPLQVSGDFRRVFENRIALVYTGTPRLAKNILQQVLRRWAEGTDEAVRTVRRLTEMSLQAELALTEGDFDRLAECLSSYFDLKCDMAGLDSGAYPEHIRLFCEWLQSAGKIQSSALCGAGGGGFLVLFAAQGENVFTLKDFVEAAHSEDGGEGPPVDCSTFTWHSCSICDVGLRVQKRDSLAMQDSSMDWLAT